jgi:NAD(P)-dependent dehydrogenase (short-subunit alcohol dehydrogenase family)
LAHAREDRAAIVTGGSKGLGRAISEKLHSDGLMVAVFARELPRGPERQATGLSMFKVDVADSNQVRKGVDSVLRKFGRLDVLVNNAGVSGPIRSVQSIGRSEWERTISVNLTGAFVCCKYAVPHIVKSGVGGRVVNISSMVWKKATAFRTPYSASKAGLVGFTRALSKELGPYGVTVNAVSPGPIEGERIEKVTKDTARAGRSKQAEVRNRLLAGSSLHRFSTPREIAALVSFLVSRDGESITGQDLNADSS